MVIEAQLDAMKEGDLDVSSAKHTSEHPALRLVGTVLRVWGVGFVLAARGTMWLVRKTVRLLPFGRPGHVDDNLIE